MAGVGVYQVRLMNKVLTTVAVNVGKSTLILYLYTHPSVTKILPFAI